MLIVAVAHIYKYKMHDMGALCETSPVKADSGADEIVSKTVLLLERYCQTLMVPKNLPVDTSCHGAARAISPIAIEETYRPCDDSVRFWQAEALSYFRKSAWEGELLATFLMAFLSWRRV